MAYSIIAESTTGAFHEGQIIDRVDSWRWTDELSTCVPDRAFARSDRGKLHPGSVANMDRVTMPLPDDMDHFMEAHLAPLMFGVEIYDPDNLLPSTETKPEFHAALGSAHGWSWSLVKANKSLMLQRVIEGRTVRLGPDAVVREGTDAEANWWPLRGLVYLFPQGELGCPVCEYWENRHKP